MPIFEERLTSLERYFEQFKAESTTYYQEMALRVTMTKGLSEDAVKRLMQLRVRVDERFNDVDLQLTEMKQRLTGVEQRLTGVEQELTEVKLVINDHTVRLDRMESRLDRMESLLVQILERLP